MNNDHYKFVINDLQIRWDSRIDQLKSSDPELKSIAQAMEGLRALIPASQLATRVQTSPPPAAPNQQGESDSLYAGISVRWAILYLLAEHTSEPLPTGPIADMLRAGGITTKGSNFNANVSAVLSNMVHERKEVRPAETGGYELTETGRQTWMHIKSSPQMQLRFADSDAARE